MFCRTSLKTPVEMATFVHLTIFQIRVLSISQDSLAPYVTFKSFDSLFWKQSPLDISAAARLRAVILQTLIVELMRTSPWMLSSTQAGPVSLLSQPFISCSL